jgi:cell fate regulator YaaT (PSP1 superfamily)
MPGSITPLPIMQLEQEEDRQRYEALQPPKSIVVRYGYLKFIAELPYDGKDKPGCGSKLVIMTQRGIELGEMLTTTCGNSGCGKSVSRKQMLQYIENSGGKDFPFTDQGKVMRVATVEDLQEQQRLEGQKMAMIRFTKALVTELGLPMKLVDIEWLLGGERIIFHYTSESWVDFRELVKQLAAQYQTRIEMHQVNARDEARLVADYEKCGQHCCCKQFLKVLKPVSMRSAKVQKATLDPTKISGRCGRLMCCLRYEDQTYEDLRKRLPHRQTRVMTDDGPGTVIDTQILTQLVLTLLDSGEPPSAYPLENIEILTRDHPQFHRPVPQEPAAREGRRDRSSNTGRGGDNRQSGSTGRVDRGTTRPTDQPQNAPAQQNHAQPRNANDRARQPLERERPTEASRQRPIERPRPGRPLADDQVESREGTPATKDDALAEETFAADDATQVRRSDLADNANDHEAGTADQASGDEQGEGGRKRRRRRRRRGRGKGPAQDGPPAGGE